MNGGRGGDGDGGGDGDEMGRGIMNALVIQCVKYCFSFYIHLG